MFFAREHPTSWAGLGAHEQIRSHFQSQPARQWTRNQIRLVATTLSKPVGTQRNGNCSGSLKMVRFPHHDFGQLGSEPISKAGDLFLFQEQDSVVECVVVDRIAAGARKRKRIRATETAKWTDRSNRAGGDDRLK
jgi:hypothetical protein